MNLTKIVIIVLSLSLVKSSITRRKKNENIKRIKAVSENLYLGL